MALDFPNTPTLNQTFTGPNGTIWMWDSVKWVAITSTSTYAGQGNVGRNLLHNSLFNVTQRGGGVWNTTSTYTADRWRFAYTGGSCAVNIVAASDAARTGVGDEALRNTLGITFSGIAGAGNDIYVEQPLEGVRRFAGKTLTLSFWAASSVNMSCQALFYQLFGTGGAGISAVTVTTALPVSAVTTAWTRFTITIPVPTAQGKTFCTNGDDYSILRIFLSNPGGAIGVQAATVYFWGVQLEIGSVATPLEKPDSRYDLANCCRFYQPVGATLRANAPAGGAIYECTVSFEAMRAIPTITTATVGTVANATAIQMFAGNTTTQSRFTISSVAAGDSYALNAVFNLSADL